MRKGNQKQSIASGYLFGTFLWIMSPAALAETIYVVDKLSIGLHQDRTIDSPIMKPVAGSTALTVIERAADLVYVQAPEGVRGWINSKYIMTDQPGRVLVTKLENENKKLPTQFDSLKIDTQTAEAPAARKELEQRLNSERLKVGELQVQLTDLKARIADIDGFGDVEKLKQENRQLVSQLKSFGVEVKTGLDLTVNDALAINNWKQMLIGFIIVFILGMIGGALMLDYSNRRRHGGFRV